MSMWQKIFRFKVDWGNVPLSKKFAVVLSVSCIAMLAVTATGLLNIYSFNDKVGALAGQTIVRDRLTSELKSATIDLERTTLQAMTSGQQKDLARRTNRLMALEIQIRNAIQELQKVSSPTIQGDLRRFGGFLEEYLAILKPTLSLIDHDLALRTGTTDNKITYDTIRIVLRNLQANCREVAHAQADLSAAGCTRLATEALGMVEELDNQSANIVMLHISSPAHGARVAQVLNNLYSRMRALLPHLSDSDKKSAEVFISELQGWLDEQSRADLQFGRNQLEGLMLKRAIADRLISQLELVATTIEQGNTAELKANIALGDRSYFRAVIILLSIGLITIVVAFAIGHTLLAGVRRRLDRIQAMSKRLAAGNLGARVANIEKDEIGRLASSFNAMAANIQESNRRLEGATKEAQKASNAKTLFLANMSHEIRTPLNAVIGHIEMLKNTKLTNVQSRHVRRIHESGDILLSIINDILDLSKIEAGAMELENSPFDLREVLEAIVSLMRAQAEEKGLELSVAIDPAIARHLMGDSMRLRQIVLNMLSNAIKFTHRGTIALVASLEDHSQRLVLKISDTGIGISTDVQKNLFQAFVQGDSSIQREFGGTGLGLIICQRLTELMHGSIDCTSREGVGTSFRILLPYCPSSKRVELAAPPPDAASAVKALAGKSVLVVDDNSVNREIVSMMLRHLGCEVHSVCDGKQAVGATNRKAFDAILMDCHMPIMDGYAATREIRRQGGSSKQVPIIALTANAFFEEKKKCLDALMDDHLAKPVTIDMLRTTLSEWIFRGKLQEGARP